MGFGGKLSRSISGLGNKVQKTAGALGSKISRVEVQAQKGITRGVHMGQGAVRDVERGIVQASGKVGAVKQGLLKGAQVIDALQTTGLASMVPGLGLGLAGASGALKSGAVGLKQLQDVGKDARLATGKAKNQLAQVGQKASSEVGRVGGMAKSNVERVGERAKALEAQAQEDVSNVRSAFAN
jgi:hypothetical protein